MKTFRFTHHYLFELNSIAHAHLASLDVEAGSVDEARQLAYVELITKGYMKNIYAYYQLDLITIDGISQRS